MSRIKKILTAVRLSIVTVLLPLAAIVALLGFSCSEATDQKSRKQQPTAEQFNQYWFQGLAEVSRFDLEQARYGEIRKGDAVLIFVTEEFFADRQVKSELGKQPGSTAVLKLNFVRKFLTGIYPYSMMSSIFTPVDREQFPYCLKVTTSIQEWCGQTFTQLNLINEKYNVLLRSYYMDEADQESTLDRTRLEDEIWTLIRMDPHVLATGNMELIPGSQFSRLKHINQKVQKADASLIEENEQYVYRVVYQTIPRKLVIKFEKAFPYKITEWEETSEMDKGADQSVLTTRAVLTHVMLVDYWNKRSVADSKYRKKLGLKE